MSFSLREPSWIEDGRASRSAGRIATTQDDLPVASGLPRLAPFSTVSDRLDRSIHSGPCPVADIDHGSELGDQQHRPDLRDIRKLVRPASWVHSIQAIVLLPKIHQAGANIVAVSDVQPPLFIVDSENALLPREHPADV